MKKIFTLFVLAFILSLSFASAEKIVLFAIDDFQTWWLEDVQTYVVNDVCMANDIPVTVSVIPSGIADDDDEGRFVARIQSWNNIPTVDIAQHGYDHAEENQFAGMPYDSQYANISTGKTLLNNIGVYPKSFIPPSCSADDNTVLVLRNLGFHTFYSCGESVIPSNNPLTIQNILFLCQNEDEGVACTFKNYNTLKPEVDAMILQSNVSLILFHMQDFDSGDGITPDENKGNQIIALANQFNQNGYTLMTVEQYYQHLNQTNQTTPTPLNITIISPESKKYIINSIMFNISINEEGSCKFSLDNSANVSMNKSGNYHSYFKTNLAEGNHNIIFYCDTSSGKSASKSVSFSVDTIIPNLKISSPENKTYNTKNISLAVSSTSTDISTWWYSLNNGPNITFIPNITFNAAEGINILKVYVNDTSGNTNSSFVTFSVDTAAFNITINSPKNIFYNTKNISLAVSSTSTDISTWWYSLNNQQNKTFTPNTTITASEGVNILRVYANNSYGRIKSSSVTFFVDTIQPQIQIFSPENKIYKSLDMNITFNISSNELLNWCNFTLDNWNTNYSMNINQNSAYSTLILSENSYTAKFLCSDFAENKISSQIDFSVVNLTAVCIIGDFDNNKNVDFQDFMKFSISYGKNSGSPQWPNGKFDFDKDNDIDFWDFMGFTDIYNCVY